MHRAREDINGLGRMANGDGRRRATPAEDLAVVPEVTYLRGTLGLSWVDIAEEFAVSVRVVERWRERVGFEEPRMQFVVGDRGDAELDAVAMPLLPDQPQVGIDSVRGHLAATGYYEETGDAGDTMAVQKSAE